MSEKRTAYAAVLVLGLVSLLGDIVYEGSRGVIPDYLRHLGASALIVGTVIGLGELISYASRPVSGIIADKFRGYWPLVFLGYGLIAALPLMAIAELWGGWLLAALLVIVERLGKGVRTPARDTIISFVSRSIGAGKAFGLHELLDQIGAVLGPLVLAVMLGAGYGYYLTFLALFIPYLALMTSLFLAKKSLESYTRHPSESESAGRGSKREVLNRETIMYIIAITLNTTGLLPASLILYQASVIAGKGYLGPWFVPILYALIQLIDAPLALVSGLIYDKVGLKMLTAPFIASILVAPLAVMGDFIPLLASALIFGFVLGTKESVYRAAITGLSPSNLRATAYGVMNTATGAASLLAGAVYGYLIDMRASPLLVLVFSLTLQLVALLILNLLIHERTS